MSETQNNLMGGEAVNILVVDDMFENLQLLSDILSTRDYKVRPATNGADALEAVEKRKPDLILLDIKMPGMDGFEVCRRLQDNAETKEIPIIFITASEDPKSAIKGLQLGAVDYIIKPFIEEEVLARIQTHIELYRIRRQLGQANSKLKELDRLKSLFIASISHELRTPLNSIMGFTGILLNEKLTPTQMDFLDRISNSSKHLLALINDLIDISKIESGVVEPQSKPFCLNGVVTEVLDLVRNFRKEAVELATAIPSDIEMHTDRNRVLQCILNLLSNALKYTEEGTVKITATEIDNQVEIKVEDTGIGISEADLSRLFHPFERLDSLLSTKIAGTGLGLYLTKKLTTEVLEGSLQVESILGKGSTFSLTIPKILKQKNP
jgi:two-component system, sensor histidine kinase and response regulator